MPQGRRIFNSLTVAENIRISSISQNENRIEWVLNIFPSLKKRLKHRGNELSGGEQQMLAIARVLVSNPELILLDEPSEGLAPLLIGVVIDRIQDLKKSGLTMLLVESNLVVASNLGDRHYIMEHGVVACQAESQQLLKDHDLQKKYFKL